MSLPGVPKLDDLLSPGDLALIASLATRRRYRDGDIIHERGDAEDSAGVVVEGQIKLINPRRDGTEVFSGLIHTYQNYGDAGLLHDEQRLHRAVAFGHTTVDHIDRQALEQLLLRPSILRAFYVIATYRLAVTLAMLDDMRTLGPTVRLARLLVKMQQAIGGGERLQFLQDEFASMLGVSTVTLAKALRQLEQEGVVSSGYRHVLVSDGARLREWLRQHEH